MSSRPLRIAMVAGEPSGDLLASHLIRALKAHVPHAEFYGIGGPKMQAQGFRSLYPMDKLAVRGYVEVLKHLPELLRLRRDLRKRLIADRPDAFIGVDAPDFNLGLEAKLKEAGITSIHFISPSIWAWRGGRVKKIVRSVDHMLCLFPFEPALYAGKGIGVTYVGHPLADVFPLEVNRRAMRERLGLPERGPVIALLPGSRVSELEYMAETYVRTAMELAERIPDVTLLVPLATRDTRILFETALYKVAPAGLPIRLLFGHAQDAMGAADVALVASGTATLEAALMKCPLVITYKMSGLSYRIMKRMAYQPFVGLPNVLAGESLAPEILQDDATPEALATALIDLLSDKARREEVQERFGDIHLRLRQDTADKAARAILGALGREAGAANALAVA